MDEPQPVASLRVSMEPAKVYILLHNASAFGDSAWVHGVYSTREKAIAVVRAEWESGCRFYKAIPGRTPDVAREFSIEVRAVDGERLYDEPPLTHGEVFP